MKFLTAAFIALVSSLTCLAEPDPKAILTRELADHYGVTEIISDAKKDLEKQGAEMIQQVMQQMRSSLPAMPAEMGKQIHAAADKLMTAVTGSWTSDEALKIWQEEFGAALSVEDLRAMVEAVKTPAGQKQIVAAKRANKSFQVFLQQRNQAALEKATPEYFAELQRIVAAATAPQP